MEAARVTAQPTREPSDRPRPVAWLLGAPGTGDNRQLEQLAGLLDVEARWIGQYDSVGRVLRDRVFGFRARTIPADKRERYQPPWPDLVLVIGGRSVVDARAIQRASGGRSRIVCLGRPWAPLDWFDLIVTTPQYRLPEADNVLVIDLPLNRAGAVPRSELEVWEREFAELPRPLVAVLLGGHSGSYRFRLGDAVRLGDALERTLAPAGAGAVILDSPRTPSRVGPQVQARLGAQVRHFDWVPNGPNPMRALLLLADAIVVTSDSASMIAEACDTGKPVAVFGLTERRRARATRVGRHVLGWLQPLLDRLARAGWWFPARDMPALLHRVREGSRVVPLERLLESSATSTRVLVKPDPRIAERVRQLL